MAAVRELNLWAIGEVMPDLTFYLRLPGEERARRARETGAPLDRIEKAGDDFMRRVEEGFEEIARLEPGRVKVLDAARLPDDLAQLALREIRARPYNP
jgi:dTMP kinase